MDEKTEQNAADEWLKNLPVQTTNESFKTEDLILCTKCARANPPTRLKCLYCGESLELSAEQTAKIAPTVRKMENWEKGFNLIHLPTVETSHSDISNETAKMLNLEKEMLARMLQTGKPLPLARAETEIEAEIVRKKLFEAGIETRVVSDIELTGNELPRRLRGLEFVEGACLLILFNNDEVVEIKAADLCLIVSGAIFQKAIESIEKRKKGESKILAASETASDEILIDIYDRSSAVGYRIPSKGFDFSGLGAEKGMLVRENMQRLIRKLREFAPRTKLVEDYLTVREFLGNVWELEQRKDSHGLKRHSFGKFDFSNVASSNNLQQFTKYSRLQWHIL